MERQKEIPAFLYKAVNDGLTIYEGTVKSVNTEVAVFQASNGSGPVRRLQVSATEGEVRNNALWLLEKDEEAAARAFIRWADAKMDEYVAKLKKLGELNYNMKSYIKNTW